MFILTRRMQFWQPCRKFFEKNLKTFRSKTENIYKIRFFSQKCSSGHVECSFDNRAENFLLKSENKCKIIIFTKKTFLKNYYSKKQFLYENALILLKGTLNKIGGRKISQWQPGVLF